MCDNIVALGPATADGAVIFGKNSDREPNEPHHVVIIPRANHPKHSMTRCTFIDIPQVRETYASLLCKPSWLWGAEMGANEHGLVIGNTAIFTREPYDTRLGLIGMDYLRLALERTSSAPAALELITGLLEQYGQSGNNGFSHELYYHNSFLIADTREAWVLETVGVQWVAKRVKAIGGTSNTITIESEWDLASQGLISYAQARGWHKNGKDFSFKESYGGSGFYTSYLYTVFGNGDERHQRLTGLLEQHEGQITVEVMLSALRDHGPKADENYTPARGKLDNPPCMHAGDGPVRVGQTTGSLVSHLAADTQTHWVTATAAPCTSIFKPVWIEAGLPDPGQVPTGRYNNACLWWRHEALHRSVLLDYAARLAAYRAERDHMEARFLAGAGEYRGKAGAERATFTAQCFAEADHATDRWTRQVMKVAPHSKVPRSYRKVWEKLDKQCGYYAAYRPDFASSPAG